MREVWKSRESARVLAARIGERVVAMMEVRERMKRMTLRFHSGQFCCTSVVSFYALF